MAEFDSVIPPGGSGRIVASVDTTKFEGRRTKSVAVRTNDPERPALTLSLSFDARPPIEVLPKRLVRITTTQGRPGRAFVVLRRDDGEPVELGAIKSSIDALSVVAVDPASLRGARPEDDARDGEAGGERAGARRGNEARRRAESESFEQLMARLGVEPRPGDTLLRVELAGVDEPLYQRGSIQIATDHPRAPQIELPFHVQVRQILIAHPRAVNLVLAPTRQPGLGRVSLRHSAGRDFGVTAARLEGDLPGVSVRVTTSGKVVAHQFELTVEDAGSPAGLYQGTVVAETTLRRSPEVRIPVTLRVSPGRPEAPAARLGEDRPEAGGS